MWSNSQINYLCFIARIEIVHHFLEIAHQHFIARCCTFQKRKQLYPVLILLLIDLFSEEFAVDEVTINRQQLRTDVRQLVTAIMGIFGLWQDNDVVYEFVHELLLVRSETTSIQVYYYRSLGFWFLSSVMMFSSRRRRVMVVDGSVKYLSKVDSSMRSQIMCITIQISRNHCLTYITISITHIRMPSIH